ncbi:hypothetical protein N9O61_06785, partial [Octadecabacter sp.]|nr:hypothetical protein [Octadecabacter sp.]
MIRWLAFFLFLSGPLAAQEYIVTDGPLSDADFYGVVSCGARPGSMCNQPLVRWTKPTVTVTFAPIPPAFPDDLAQEMSDKLDAS